MIIFSVIGSRFRKKSNYWLISQELEWIDFKSHKKSTADSTSQLNGMKSFHDLKST